jgi:hypothetical protein
VLLEVAVPEGADCEVEFGELVAGVEVFEPFEEGLAVGGG